jgi:N-acetylmuramoyl-L-alanine amidase
MHKKRLYSTYDIKRKILIFLFSGVFFLSVFSTIYAADDLKNKVLTVVIDPGHGGKDPGALGKQSKEKDIVMAISLRLKEYIEENIPDVNVVLTRDSDQFVPLHERADIANQLDADLFISIHANANEKTSPYGAETYAMGLHANDLNFEVAKKENSVITLEDNYKTEYEGFDPTSAESYIIFSLIQNTYLNQSLSFASFIQSQINMRANRFNRGVKQAGFLVLWRTSMPSVLIEIGFLTNANEEKFLISENGQDSIAKAIYHAFHEYKITIETQSMFDDKSIDKHKDEVTEQPVVIKPKQENRAKPDISGKEKNIRFKVQVLVSSKEIPVKSELFKGLNDVEMYKMSKIYKYAVGNEHSYQKITEYSKNVKQHFPDAFIIAVKGDEIISVSQAMKEIQK